VQRLDITGRRLCVLTAPGDRRDEDLAEIARIAAGVFDHYILRRDDNLRGRGPDEVPTRLAEMLAGHGVGADKVTIIPDEQEAIAAALAMARPLDLLLIFGDNITRCWKQIIYFKREGDAPTAASAPLPLALEAGAELATLEGSTLIRDERGVRMAREVETAD